MMKNYVKPIVLANEELAEGVYAASGAVGNANCWTISVRSDQDWNGSHHVFEVTIVHSDTVQHISTESTSVLTFSHALTDAYTESDFSASFGGNTMMVVRSSHANSYKSGDRATFKVWAKAEDEATTKALAVTASSISDTGKTVNVQGNGANGD